jgi:C4-dicarboxylate-specific signal transduction histidine kinase
MFTKAATEKTSVQMNELIREVAAIMQTEASRSEVRIEMDLLTDLPAALGDRTQLQQVLVNLIRNGVEAMNGITDRPRLLVIRSEMEDPDLILVAVRDSGAGINSKDIKRIFDAFFTTKALGTGMGLSISRSIIEAHGGRLWASANSDYGATFQFTLPMAVESVQ